MRMDAIPTKKNTAQVIINNFIINQQVDDQKFSKITIFDRLLPLIFQIIYFSYNSLILSNLFKNTQKYSKKSNNCTIF